MDAAYLAAYSADSVKSTGTRIFWIGVITAFFIDDLRAKCQLVLNPN
jgi:phage terminase small subunit